jgi:hypothetical protein
MVKNAFGIMKQILKELLEKIELHFTIVHDVFTT